ncbi:MAG: SUMF1/EgtB/PvdO family nonheme iron enzyme [Bacteroidales bacterium]|nr:SUMF1/EgtB/PvdO family nonheme iron enzyme [Bacteroidales bacterium]
MSINTQTIHTFAEGDLFDGRYRLVKLAGSGGFADVWRAEDTLRRNKVVALKIYTRLDEEGIRQMSEEYDATEHLRHTNLLTGNHFAAVGNIPYMEMQFCDGGSLSRKVGKLTTDEIRHVMHDILSGLAYLHSEGIVHQDIKPENILHDSEHNRYMLADFGISGESRTRMSKSVNRDSSSLSMTLAYAPPEKFSSNPNDWEPSTKGDIFSLGVTLYELATGHLPFAQPVNTGDRMLEKKGNVEIYFDNIADPQLRQLAQNCIRYRKEDRPTAEELLAMLDGKGAPQPEPKPEPEPKPDGRKTVKIDVPTPTADTTATPKTPARKSNWWLFLAVAAVAIALGVMIPRACMKHEPAAVDTVADTIADTVAAQTPPAPTLGRTSEPAKDKKPTQATQTPSNPENTTTQTATSGLRMDGNDIIYGSHRYKMIWVSGGSYMMGAPDSDGEAYSWEKPQHSVTVSGFYMGQTEVPQWLWKAVMGSNPSKWKGDDLPVEHVSWNDCKEFISKLNSLTGKTFRLPTEEEWEFAARGGNSSRGYKYSGGFDIGGVAWYAGNSDDKTHPVAQKRANELGLYDMTGNVWEWCSNCWRKDYNSGTDCSYRVCRGGGRDNYNRNCRVSCRNNYIPSSSLSDLGFRLVCR